MEVSEESIFEVLGVQPSGQQEQEPGPIQEPVPEPEPGPAQGTEPEQGLKPDSIQESEPAQEPELVREPEPPPKAAGMEETQTVEKAIQQAVQQAVRTERERSQKEIEGFFAQAGLKNTVTGAPITTMEEFQAWRRDFAAEKLQRDLKAGKLTQEGLDQAIAQNPAVQKMEQLARQNEEIRKHQDIEAAQRRVETEMEEIRKLDPSIREVKDLLTMPKAREFYGYVKKGNSFLDAFYLANREELAQRQAAAARQQAINNARSKDHLKSVKPQGSGAAGVPADEMALFRELMPEAKDAEIQAWYSRNKK